MPYIDSFHTAAALAEDIRSLRRGGGPLTDNESLTEAQVLYWIATGMAAIQAEKLALAGQRGTELLDTDLVDLTLPLDYDDDLMSYASADFGRVVRMGGRPVLREATLNGRTIAVADTGPSRVGMSRFGRPSSTIYSFGKRLIADLVTSEHYEEPMELSLRGMVQVDIDTILKNPDLPLVVPQSWVDELRLSLLQPTQITLQTQPDQTTNVNPAR